MNQQEIEDADGNKLHDGDRVFTYDYIDKKPTRVYGSLYKNEDHPKVSDWYVKYDDGGEFAVLEPKLLYKA